MEPTNETVLPDVSPGTPTDPAIAPAPADDGGGAAANVPDAGTIARAAVASAAAVDIHLDESKGRGKRGRDKKPRRLPPQCLPGGVPLAEMGNGTSEAHLREGIPTPLEGFQPPVATFDREFFVAGAALTTDLANDIAATGMEWYALQQLGDQAAATLAAQKVRMKAEREERIRKTLVRFAEQNPEKAAKFFGWLAIADPALWLGDIAKQVQAVKEQGQRLREQQPQQREAA